MEEIVSDIHPVVKEKRNLGFFDFFVLWGDLGISLLVILAGSFLIPGLSLFNALIAIIIGSVIGCFFLMLVGVIGSKTHVPTMVLMRSVFGIRGSYIPSAINTVQLIGWCIFEFIIMAVGVNALLHNFLGNSSYILSLALIAFVVIIMTLIGPTQIIRQWLRKFALWVVLIASAWLAYRLFSTHDILKIFMNPGDNSISFWSGIDLVIAQPISWLPLVADYNRFSRGTREAAYGTFAGYFVSNVWFYFLGALLIITTQVSQETHGFVESIIAIGGWLALLIILIDETHEAWPNLYSSAVSTQNILPKFNQKVLIILIGIISLIIASLIDITLYQSFLYLIGSVFIPLFAILIADFFLLKKGKLQTAQLYRSNGEFWFSKGINWFAIGIWIIGIAVYQIISNKFPQIGASTPSFVSVVIIYILMFKYILPEFKRK